MGEKEGSSCMLLHVALCPSHDMDDAIQVIFNTRDGSVSLKSVPFMPGYSN